MPKTNECGLCAQYSHQTECGSEVFCNLDRTWHDIFDAEKCEDFDRARDEVPAFEPIE